MENNKNIEDAMKILLEALESANQQVFDLREDQIELFNKLLESDKKVQSLTKIIAELKYPSKEKKEVDINATD